MVSGPDLSTPAAQRAWSKLIQQEEADIQQEIEAAQLQAQMGRAQRDQQMRAAALKAIEQLKALAPAYLERQQAAERALSVLAEFIALERGLSIEERRIMSSVPATGLDGGQAAQNVLQMRQAAGLPVRHDALGLAVGPDEAQRVGLTCLMALMAGLIGDKVINAGGVQIIFNF